MAMCGQRGRGLRREAILFSLASLVWLAAGQSSVTLLNTIRFPLPAITSFCRLDSGWPAEGVGLEHIDSYAYATAPSQRGQRESWAADGEGHAARSSFFDSDSLEKTSSIPFRDRERRRRRLCPCPRPGWEHAQTWDVQGCDRDGFFFAVLQNNASIHMTVRGGILWIAGARQEQDLPLTDRPVWVSSVKIFQTLMGLLASLYPCQRHIPTLKRCAVFYFPVDHLSRIVRLSST